MGFSSGWKLLILLVNWRYMAGIGIRIRFIWVMYSWASRAQWRFGIFAVGLQMAIKLNQVNQGRHDAVTIQRLLKATAGRCLRLVYVSRE